MKQLTLVIFISITAVFASAQKKYDLVKDFGAKPDNSTDCYAAMQKAATVISKAGGGILNIPNGKYYIGKVKITGGKNENHIGDITFINCRKLTIKGNGSTIRVNGQFLRTEDYSYPGVLSKYSYEETVIPFHMTNCTRVLIQDMILDGGVRDMRKENINEGNCSGIVIDDYGKKEWCSNGIIIKNIVSDYFATDGITLRCRGSNILVSNCKATCNGRQGMSIVAGRNIIIDKCEFDSTGYTGTYGAHAPAAGIDVECDDTLNLPIKDVLIKNCSMRYNLGFQVVTTVASHNVHIDSCFISDPKYGYSDDIQGVGMYSTNSSLTNSIIYGTVWADLGDQIYKGTSLQQYTGNIIYSGWRAILSSGNSRPCNISGNILVMLPQAAAHEYFPFIQNTNCTFSDNIIMMNYDRMVKEPGGYAALVQHTGKTEGNFWMVNGYSKNDKGNEAYYRISFDGSEVGKQYFSPRKKKAPGNSGNEVFISTRVYNKIIACPLFTSYTQKAFNKQLLKDANQLMAFLSNEIK